MPFSVAWIEFYVGCCLDIEDHHVWALALVPVSFRCCWRVGNCSSGWIETNCMTNLWSLSLFVHLSISRYICLPTNVPSSGSSDLSVFIYIMTGPSGFCSAHHSCTAMPIVMFVRISEWVSVWTFLFVGYILAEFPAYCIVPCSRWCKWR